MKDCKKCEKNKLFSERFLYFFLGLCNLVFAGLGMLGLIFVGELLGLIDSRAGLFSENFIVYGVPAFIVSLIFSVLVGIILSFSCFDKLEELKDERDN